MKHEWIKALVGKLAATGTMLLFWCWYRLRLPVRCPCGLSFCWEGRVCCF